MGEEKLTIKKRKQLKKTIAKFSGPGEVIALLLAVQREDGFLSREVLKQISIEKGLPLSALYGIATFYSQFSLHPRGKHVIRVCQGTACHVQGATQIAETLKQELGIGEGETTQDKMFTLEYVNCLGCCSLAPVLVTNNAEVQAKMTSAKARKLIRELKRR